MKFVIERGFVIGTKEEKWSTEDGRSGVNLKLCVKDKVGDGEFGAIVIHELDVYVESPSDFARTKSEYESYKEKVCRIEGTAYTRRYTKDKKTTVFADFQVDTIEIV